MVISIGMGKAFDKIKQPFMIKLQKPAIKGICFNKIKAVYDNS